MITVSDILHYILSVASNSFLSPAVRLVILTTRPSLPPPVFGVSAF